ncbi:MAG: Ku protein, partial [Methylotenera sp.]
HTKEHLAVLIPFESALMLNTIRWESEMKPMSDLKLPPKGKTDLKTNELKMATQLIGEMTSSWKAADFKDKFSNTILKLVNHKIELGETEKVEPLETFNNEEEMSNVVDLTNLLIQSLKKNKAV